MKIRSISSEIYPIPIEYFLGWEYMCVCFGVLLKRKDISIHLSIYSTDAEIVIFEYLVCLEVDYKD